MTARHKVGRPELGIYVVQVKMQGRDKNGDLNPLVAHNIFGQRQWLPVGMQLIGPRFGEAQLLNIAHQFQRRTDWHSLTPNLESLTG